LFLPVTLARWRGCWWCWARGSRIGVGRRVSAGREAEAADNRPRDLKCLPDSGRKRPSPGVIAVDPLMIALPSHPRHGRGGRGGSRAQMTHLVLAIAAAALAASPESQAKLPSSLDLSMIRAIPVQYDGRWPPLDTEAREIVESVTGEAFYRGYDPVLLLLAWTFESQTWSHEPLIAIGSRELRHELELPATQTVFSYTELVGQQRLRALIDDLARMGRGHKPDPLESKVSDINGKLVTLQEVFRGRAIKLIPDPEELAGAWRPIVLPATNDSGKMDRTQAAWAALRDAFLADDAVAFASASKDLTAALEALPAAHRPGPRLIKTELRYNRLQPFRTAWIVMVIGALLAAVAMFIRRRSLDVVAIAGMVAGFAVLTYGLWLRWHIAGRIPAADMFESLLFLSWGMGAFAILSMIVVRDRIVPLTASAMGAVALMLADLLPLDHSVRPIAPVLLDTIWMSIHVPIIMVSYSVLTLAVLIAHVQLVVMAAFPRRRRLADTVDSMHYWYVHAGSIVLLAGIITGSIWAASSWGRYWGWDPKEVWSLVAFLAYLAILHVRIDHEPIPPWLYVVAAVLGVALFVLVIPKLGPLTLFKVLALAGTGAAMLIFVLARGQFATALKSIVAFWLIIMTYVGVNFVLGIGLHSYGFGTGAVVRYMLLIGGIDLALIAACSLIYVARLRLWPSLAAEAPPGVSS
jgi:ABC-type transport system involved in cytochrome c biogenesis permease subunit